MVLSLTLAGNKQGWGQDVESGGVKEWEPGGSEPGGRKIRILCPEQQLSLHFVNSVLFSFFKYFWPFLIILRGSVYMLLPES